MNGNWSFFSFESFPGYFTFGCVFFFEDYLGNAETGMHIIFCIKSVLGFCFELCQEIVGICLVNA